MKAATIYLVTNTINGKTYVGLTRYPVAKRWGEHKGASRKGKNSIFYAAMRKYGVEATMFDSVSEAAEMTGCHVSSVSKVCLGKRNQVNGLNFSFVGVGYRE